MFLVYQDDSAICEKNVFVYACSLVFAKQRSTGRIFLAWLLIGHTLLVQVYILNITSGVGVGIMKSSLWESLLIEQDIMWDPECFFSCEFSDEAKDMVEPSPSLPTQHRNQPT